VPKAHYGPDHIPTGCRPQYRPFLLVCSIAGIETPKAPKDLEQSTKRPQTIMGEPSLVFKGLCFVIYISLATFRNVEDCVLEEERFWRPERFASIF
jgi:hypothetical protein